MNGRAVMERCPVALDLSGGVTLGENIRVVKSEESRVDRRIIPEIPRKKAIINDTYNELSLKIRGNYNVVFRVYDYGVAYRFETSFKNDIEILTEKMEINFSDNMVAWFPGEESFVSHYERSYTKEQTEDIDPGRFASLPVLFKSEKGVNVLFTEADLFDYPCAFLFGTGRNSVKAGFPKKVLEVTLPEKGADRNEIISRQADYIAKTNGSRTFPWRLFYITDNDADLVKNDLLMMSQFPLSEWWPDQWILLRVPWITPNRQISFPVLNVP